MKRSIQRTAGTLLAIALTAGLFAACGNQESAPPSGSSSGEGSNSGASAGESVEIVIAKNQLTDGIHEQEVRDAITAKIEQDLGVKVQFTVITAPEVDALNQKIYLMSSSGEPLDIISNHSVQLPNLLAKPGLIAPLDELLDQYGPNIKKSIPAGTFDRFRVKGQIMVIPDNDGDTVQDGIIVRQDWLDKLGLPLPRTLTEFETMLEAFRTLDPDGNGQNDTVPLVAQENRMNLCFAPCVTGLAPSTFTMPGVWDYLDEQTGEIRPTFIHPRYKDQLAFIKKWYDNGWLNKDFLITTGDQNRELFRQGKAGAYADTWWLVEMEGDMRKALGDGVKLSAVTQLEGPAGDLWFGRLKTSGIVAIPEQSKNKELAVRLIDWMLAGEENYRLCKYGIEGLTYKTVGERQWDLPNPEDNSNQYSRFFTSVVLPEYELYPASAPENYAQMKESVNSADRKVVYGAADGVTVVFNQYKNVQAQCDTVRKERLTKMATGAESIDNFDDFVEEWLRMGGDSYIQEKTAAYQEHQKNIQK